MGFEVLYAQAMPSVAHSLLLLPVDQDVELSAPSLVPSLPTPMKEVPPAENQIPKPRETFNIEVNSYVTQFCLLKYTVQRFLVYL